MFNKKKRLKVLGIVSLIFGVSMSSVIATGEGLGIPETNDGIIASTDITNERVEPITTSTTPLHFTIMHTNDMHGRLENDPDKTLGMARLKTYKDQMNPTLMLDGGDSVQGLAISNFTYGISMAKAMNAIPYDAAAVGNHEFDFGYDKAMDLKNNIPLLSANTYKENALSFEPYKLIEKEGVTYAVIGLTTPETAFKTHPNNVRGVSFLDPIPVAKKLVGELSEQADAFIFLSHLGVDPTTPVNWRGNELAKVLSESFPNEKIIVIDGHSHTALPTGQRYGNVLLAQTGNYLNNVGMIDVTYPLEGEPTLEAKLVSVKELQSLPEDPTVKGIVDEAKNQFQEEMGHTIIQDNPVYFEGDGAYGRTRETNLGNIIADAMYDYGQTGFINGQTDLAVINGGGIRTSIETGLVTKGDLLAVLPFGNSIAQIDVTGKELKDMFEYSIRSEVQTNDTGDVLTDEGGLPLLGRNGGFLQVSHSVNLTYDPTVPGYDPVNNPTGKRILSLKILDAKTGVFKEVMDDQIYKLATNDFLAAGGDGYTMLGGSREEGPSLDTVFTDFLTALSPEKSDKVVSFASGKYQLEDYKVSLPYTRLIPTSEKESIKKELVTLQEEITQLNSEEYTANSWEQLMASSKTTEALLKDEQATATQLLEQKKTLIDRKDALVTIKELLIAFEETDQLVEKDYTESSWRTFILALDQADNVLKKSQEVEQVVTQEEVDASLLALQNSMSSLEKVSTLPVTPIEKPSSGSGATGNGKLPQTGEVKGTFIGLIGFMTLGTLGSYWYSRYKKEA